MQTKKIPLDNDKNSFIEEIERKHKLLLQGAWPLPEESPYVQANDLALTAKKAIKFSQDRNLQVQAHAKST